MSNLNDVFDKLIEKQKSKYDTITTNLKLKDALHDYIGCCEKYVKFRTGYSVVAYNEEFPFNDVVNQVDGVKFERDLNCVFKKFFVRIDTGDKTWFGFKKYVKFECFSSLNNWHRSDKNQLKNELALVTIDKLNKRMGMLQKEMKSK